MSLFDETNGLMNLGSNDPDKEMDEARKRHAEQDDAWGRRVSDIKNANNPAAPKTKDQNPSRPGDSNKAPNRPAGPSLAKQEAKAAEQPQADQKDDVGGALEKELSLYRPGKRRRAVVRVLEKLGKRKALTGGVVGTFLVVIIAFASLSPFQLLHLIESVNFKTFLRLDQDVRNRSMRWLGAYAVARLMEIEGAKTSDGSPDNLLFRSEEIQRNPFTDWYVNMRGKTQKFESEVWNINEDNPDDPNRGIKFTSIARKNPDTGLIEFRTAKITIKGTPLTFDPFSGPDAINPDTLDRALKGDISALQEIQRLTGKLDEFVHVEVFESNQEARSALRAVVVANLPHWNNALKRLFVRASIANMIGLPHSFWTFFERVPGVKQIIDVNERAREWARTVSLKLAKFALPSSTRSGRFMQCIFGISDCKASSDPSHPNNRTLPDAGTTRPDGKTVDHDGDTATPPIPVADPAAGTGALEQAAQEAAQGAEKMVLQMIAKVAKASNPISIAISILDALSRFDKLLRLGTLSLIIEQARMAQVIGIYTSYAVAADQMKTGEIDDGGEVQALMGTLRYGANSEGWQKGVEQRSNTSLVSAAEFEAAKTRQEFCSNEHQAERDLPENREKAEQEYHPLCPAQQIGGASDAKALSEAWVNTTGPAVGHILSAYDGSIGAVSRVVDDVLGAVTDPIVNGAMSAAGLDDNLADAVGWAGAKAVEFGGGGPMTDETTTGAERVNLIVQGAVATAETSSRSLGAAATTPETSQAAIQNTVAYLEERQQNTSLKDRYLSFSNHSSLASKSLFSLLNIHPSGVLKALGSTIVNPLRFLSKGAMAAETTSIDPYAGARFAGIETYDFPAQCMNLDPILRTPAGVTNADELGIFKSEELSWEIVTNGTAFYDTLYGKLGDNDALGKQVWNCALLDNAVSGSMGALYGYKGVGAYDP